MELPNPLEGIAEIIKAAAKAEFGTPAGKVNATVMILAVVVIALNTTTGWIEDVIRAFRPKAVSSPTDFMTLFVIFLVFGLLCVLMVMINDNRRSDK